MAMLFATERERASSRGAVSSVSPSVIKEVLH